VLSNLALAAEDHRRRRIWDAMFPAQQAAVADTSPLRAYQCDRRAGKTTSVAHEFVLDAYDGYPRAEYAYIALTRSSAWGIAWPIIRETNFEFGLSAKMRENLLRVELPIGAALTLYGADRDDWIDRLYGRKLRKIWIDEAAFFTASLRRLVYDILQPTVSDLRGSLTLMSRPGHVQRGLFWDVMSGKLGGWSRHKWGWGDNPNMRAQTEELIARESAANPDWLNWASTRRNYFNEWALEAGQRVYSGFDFDRNLIEKFPIADPRDFKFTLGVDFGWTHPTAFVMGCWSPAMAKFVVLEAFKEPRMTIDSMAQRIRMYMDNYPGLQVVADPAGAREIAELRRRHRVAVRVAEKTAKVYWINQLNADLSKGDVVLVNGPTMPLVEEMADLVWESDIDGQPVISASTKELVEHRHMPNDCCDATLYAYRASRHHEYQEPKKPVEAGSREYFEQLADQMEEEAEAELLREETDDDDFE
jgi:hypothetical protein